MDLIFKNKMFTKWDLNFCNWEFDSIIIVTNTRLSSTTNYVLVGILKNQLIPCLFMDLNFPSSHSNTTYD